jgi:diaminopimelate epimerase
MHFYKYQGTGNDFVMVDDRENKFDLEDHELVKHLCDRRFGIGADGLILLRLSDEAHFEMVYYNSDGNLSSMCGNGGRCIARFAQQLGLIENHCTFKAIDGMHHAVLDEYEVALQMKDVELIEKGDGFYYLDTGSPHYVTYIDDMDSLDIVNTARKIRYNERFKDFGTNVNFVNFEKNILSIRTYERGVEDETLSCGTGITAAALVHAFHENYKYGSHIIQLAARGGMLKVSFDFHSDNSFTNIQLIGPAELVFEGDV